MHAASQWLSVELMEESRSVSVVIIAKRYWLLQGIAPGGQCLSWCIF